MTTFIMSTQKRTLEFILPPKNIEHARAIRKSITRDAHCFRLSEPEIGQRRLVRAMNMTPLLQLPTASAGDNNRQISVLMRRAIAQA